MTDGSPTEPGWYFVQTDRATGTEVAYIEKSGDQTTIKLQTQEEAMPLDQCTWIVSYSGPLPFSLPQP